MILCDREFDMCIVLKTFRFWPRFSLFCVSFGAQRIMVGNASLLSKTSFLFGCEITALFVNIYWKNLFEITRYETFVF